MTPLEKLKASYPIFVIKNKLGHSNEFHLADGDSVVFPPLGTKKIASAGIIQMPDPVKFEVISPDVTELISHGVIKMVQPVSPPSQNTNSNQNSNPVSKDNKENK